MQTMTLNKQHLTPETIDELKQNNLSAQNHEFKDNLMFGLVIEFTEQNNILIIIDREIIQPSTLTANAIWQTMCIPPDLQLCLLYALDHNCDQIYFNTTQEPIMLLPYYVCTTNKQGEPIIKWVQYNGMHIQAKYWPNELLPE